jgi:HAD superfamily hydrolase (TIGR01509 family)
MPFSAVLFDLGQTLLDYGPHQRWPEFRIQRMTELYPLVTRMCGPTNLSAEEFGRVVGAGIQTNEMRAAEHSGLSVPFRSRLLQALAAAGVSPEDGQLEPLTDAFNEPVRAWPKPFAETDSVLRELRSLGMSLAIITNSPWDTPSEALYSDLDRYGLRGVFSAFVGSGEVPWRKPNPEFMWAAARQLGIASERCLVVGDNIMADIGGARAAGMRSAWVNREGAAVPPDAAQPDWTVKSLTEVLSIVRSG